jgi:hypothetical protein
LEKAMTQVEKMEQLSHDIGSQDLCGKVDVVSVFFLQHPHLNFLFRITIYVQVMKANPIYVSLNLLLKKKQPYPILKKRFWPQILYVT